jgi:hypothetical protein
MIDLFTQFGYIHHCGHVGMGQWHAAAYAIGTNITYISKSKSPSKKKINTRNEIKKNAGFKKRMISSYFIRDAI